MRKVAGTPGAAGRDRCSCRNESQEEEEYVPSCGRVCPWRAIPKLPTWEWTRVPLAGYYTPLPGPCIRTIPRVIWWGLADEEERARPDILIRGNLFSFHLMTTTIITQIILISDIKSFV